MPGALRPPNILLLFCDQLRADVLGCYGHPFAVTPAIDGLAARGTVFDSAYTPSPVCVPARCSLVFGAEPGETGCHDNGFPMPGDPPSLMSRLADQGYRTHGVGKMHFSGRPPERWGFHTRDVGEEFGTAAGDDYVRFLAERGYGHVERPHGLRSEMYYLPQLSPVPEQLHYSHWVADRSLDFLRTRPRDQPFFLWSSFIHPHPPFAPPSPWHRLYPPALMPDPRRPPSGAELLTVHNIKQNRYKFRDGGEDRRLRQLIIAYYLACVSFVDAQIGRILAALAATGELADTLVLLSADHGEFLGDYGCFGKRSFLDPAARVPLVCTGPGFPPGRSRALASLIDVLPTLLAAAGEREGAATREGRPLQDAGQAARTAVYGQLQRGEVGLYLAMTRRWKYVYSAADRREYLLDRVRDPHETMNLAYNAYCREPLLAMRERAAGHFDELSSVDFDAVAENRPLSLGDDAEAATMPAIARDPDAGFLLIPDDDPIPVGDSVPDRPDSFARYRSRFEAAPEPEGLP
jgi:arylsulfatase